MANGSRCTTTIINDITATAAAALFYSILNCKLANSPFHEVDIALCLTRFVE